MKLLGCPNLPVAFSSTASRGVGLGCWQQGSSFDPQPSSAQQWSVPTYRAFHRPHTNGGQPFRTLSPTPSTRLINHLSVFHPGT